MPANALMSAACNSRSIAVVLSDNELNARRRECADDALAVEEEAWRFPVGDPDALPLLPPLLVCADVDDAEVDALDAFAPRLDAAARAAAASCTGGSAIHFSNGAPSTIAARATAAAS